MSTSSNKNNKNNSHFLNPNPNSNLSLPRARRPSITTSRSSPDLRAHLREDSGFLTTTTGRGAVGSSGVGGTRKGDGSTTATTATTTTTTTTADAAATATRFGEPISGAVSEGGGISLDSSSDDDSNSDEDSDGGTGTGTGAGSSRRHGQRHSHLTLYSLNSMHPSSFAPPFYNRPPTPLPPSPSLTSLLRPTFHTTTTPSSTTHTPLPSRPTTPDSSDSEAVAHSSLIAQATPRAAPRVPTYEYYGFVLYLVSSLAFLIYIIWSYSPSPLLHSLGIHYYPNRWWSLAFPSWIVVLVIYVYVALASYNTGYLTRGLDAIEAVVDVVAKVAVVEAGVYPPPPPGGGGEGKRNWNRLWNVGTDGVMDVPLGGVCEVLYGEEREREEWEEEEEEEVEEGEAGEGEEGEEEEGEEEEGEEEEDSAPPPFSPSSSKWNIDVDTAAAAATAATTMTRGWFGSFRDRKGGGGDGAGVTTSTAGLQTHHEMPVSSVPVSSVSPTPTNKAGSTSGGGGSNSGSGGRRRRGRR